MQSKSTTTARVLLITGILFVLNLTINAQCVYTFQPGPHNGKDARVWNLLSPNYVDTNFGSDRILLIATWTWLSVPGIKRTFIEFDLSLIENLGCSVQRAVLTLHHDGAPSQFHCGQSSQLHPCDSNSFKVKRVVEEWNEDSITWNKQPGVTDIVSGKDYVQLADNSEPFISYEINLTDMVNF
ncbi:MAG: DNRLRE domain-containing protein, partial [Bacteroidetes bacterium]|nr:DNRLRE domain-containing protein [Bacteroidota bacterium]